MYSLTKADSARFWAKVDRSDPFGCWPWTGCVVRKYGMFHLLVDGKQHMVKAHRIAYELLRGAIPGGLPLDHRCHMEHCVRPSHLQAVTVKQNAEHRQGANHNSTSGVRNVHWDSTKGKWRVVVGHNSKHVQGGLFDDLDKAADKARELRAELFTNSLAG